MYYNPPSQKRQSYFLDIDHHICSCLNRARHRLIIAVAWFTSERLGNALLQKRNTDIEIIVDDNKINRNSGILQRLRHHNIDVSFIQKLQERHLMHHKFCVIDNKILITGSYNWTANANNNDENISVIEDEFLSTLHSLQFRKIKQQNSDDDEMISVPPEQAEAHTESIFTALLTLLKENVNSRRPGLLSGWKDERIKNRIRVEQEIIRNNLFETISPHWLFMDLISKYGYRYAELASEEEMVRARDQVNKLGVEELPDQVIFCFEWYKMKALTKLQDRYSKLLELKKTDMNSTNRIVDIFQFITKEKLAVHAGLNPRFTPVLSAW